ncbi:MAG: alpha/beta hydrolase [Halieaceae bacterium]
MERHQAFAELAADLPVLQLESAPAGAGDLDEHLDDYLDFYGINFGEEFPQARHTLGRVESGAHHVAVQVWQQPGADNTLLLVHGYFDHVGLFGHLIRFGLSRGANVVAFDLPGHGLSSGEQAEISDFEEYRQAIVDVLAAVRELPGARQVIAQSTGAAAVMEYVQVTADPVFDQLVLLAPLVRPHSWGRIKLAHTLFHRWIREIPRKFAENSQDREFLRFLRTDPLQSTIISVRWLGALRAWIKRFLAHAPLQQELLILQGDDDGTVDWVYNIPQIQQKFPRATVHYLPGGRHHLANESGELRQSYLAIIAAYLDAATLRGAGGSATLK